MNILQHNIDGNDKSITGLGSVEADIVKGNRKTADGSDGLTTRMNLIAAGHGASTSQQGALKSYYYSWNLTTYVFTIKGGLITAVSSSRTLYDSYVYKTETIE